MGKSQREPRKKRRHGDEVNAKAKAPENRWLYIAFLVLLCGGAAPIVLPLFDKMSAAGWFDLSSPAFVDVDPNSTEALKEVFFSGNPWLVLCKNHTNNIPKVWKLAGNALAADPDPQGIQLGVMPCFDPLPSGKTVYERFPTIKAPPTNVYVPRPAPHAFYVANGKRPVMLSQSYFGYKEPDAQVGEKIIKHVKKSTRPSHGIVASNSELQSKCLKKGLCAVVLNKGKFDSEQQELVKQLMYAHRLVSFVRLDTNKRKLSLQGQLPAISGLTVEESSKEARVVLLKKRKKDNGKGFLALALDQPFTQYYAGPFIASASAKLNEGGEDAGEVLVLNKAPKIAMMKNAKSGKKAKGEKKDKAAKKPSKDESDSKAKSKKVPKDKKETPKSKEEQSAREQARREEMDREAKESFAYVEDADEDEDEIIDLEEDEDDLIDLDDGEEF